MHRIHEDEYEERQGFEELGFVRLFFKLGVLIRDAGDMLAAFVFNKE